MKIKGLTLLVFAIALVIVGCGGAGVEKSSSQTLNFTLLQVEGEYLVEGTVFNDANNNTVIDSIEVGIEGVVVDLTDTDDNLLETTVTDANGYYAFAVTAGKYKVVETDPAGFTSTTLNTEEIEVIEENVTVNFGDRFVEEIDVDVKPGSDINPLNLKSKGVLPVAILGSETFDVTQIDPDSLLLNGVAPLRWSYEDVCGNDDDMTWDPDMPDGFADMTLKFSTQEIAQTLGDVERGDIVTLYMEGLLFDGMMVLGEEMVWIVQVPKK